MIRLCKCNNYFGKQTFFLKKSEPFPFFALGKRLILMIAVNKRQFLNS